MNFIFFQNCISPHQIPYIRECANDERVDSVYLIVPRKDYAQRAAMGWDSSGLLKGTSIICRVMPRDEEIETLINDNKDCFCFFSGIRADADVFRWFKISLAYDVKRFIITEPPLTYNKPLWMHYLRFYLQDYKYVRYIKGVFGFGLDAVDYYRSISDKWSVFPFQYVTESHQRTSCNRLQGKMKLLFVGSLSKRKNVCVVLDALKELDDVEFTIVGDGDKLSHLRDIVLRHRLPVTFLGKRQMAEIPDIMEQHDILILPSLHDGWGAVVNEAMTLGLYVITSDRCGAKALIKNEQAGVVFKNNDAIDLRIKLQKCIADKAIIRDGLIARLEKCRDIQGPAVAHYFINCLKNL